MESAVGNSKHSLGVPERSEGSTQRPVGGGSCGQGGEHTGRHTCMMRAGLSGVLENCIRGQGGEEMEKESLGSRNIRTAPDSSGSREPKEERKALAKSKPHERIATHPPLHLEVFLTSVASGFCSFLWEEPSAPPAEPKSRWPERTPRDQHLPLPTSSLLLYFLSFFFFSIYNIILISGVQHNDAVFLQIILH